jgi:hypothetical protein
VNKNLARFGVNSMVSAYFADNSNETNEIVKDEELGLLNESSERSFETNIEADINILNDVLEPYLSRKVLFFLILCLKFRFINRLSIGY